MFSGYLRSLSAYSIKGLPAEVIQKFDFNYFRVFVGECSQLGRKTHITGNHVELANGSQGLDSMGQRQLYNRHELGPVFVAVHSGFSAVPIFQFPSRFFSQKSWPKNLNQLRQSSCL